MLSCPMHPRFQFQASRDSSFSSLPALTGPGASLPPFVGARPDLIGLISVRLPVFVSSVLGDFSPLFSLFHPCHLPSRGPSSPVKAGRAVTRYFLPLSSRWSAVVLPQETLPISFQIMALRDSFVHNEGGTPYPPRFFAGPAASYTFFTSSNSFTFSSLRTLLRYASLQLLSFQLFPHSFRKTTGVGTPTLPMRTEMTNQSVHHQRLQSLGVRRRRKDFHAYCAKHGSRVALRNKRRRRDYENFST
jgi:hypothetical protein